jgi:hypothetical protein
MGGRKELSCENLKSALSEFYGVLRTSVTLVDENMLPRPSASVRRETESFCAKGTVPGASL